MTKLDSLRRVFFSCFSSTTNHRTATTTTPSPDQDSDSSPLIITTTTNPPPPSNTTLIGTLFGHRHGYVYFAIQLHHRHNPSLLLQLSIQTQTLLHQIHSGLVRLALEAHTTRDSHLRSCPLRSIPTWTLYCNGLNFGFAVRKKATKPITTMLKAMAIKFDDDDNTTTTNNNNNNNNNNIGEVIYMRANYECIVGGPDSESFHLVNPDGSLGNGHDLSIFLMRTGGPSF